MDAPPILGRPRVTKSFDFYWMYYPMTDPTSISSLRLSEARKTCNAFQSAAAPIHGPKGPIFYTARSEIGWRGAAPTARSSASTLRRRRQSRRRMKVITTSCLKVGFHSIALARGPRRRGAHPAEVLARIGGASPGARKMYEEACSPTPPALSNFDAISLGLEGFDPTRSISRGQPCPESLQGTGLGENINPGIFIIKGLTWCGTGPDECGVRKSEFRNRLDTGLTTCGGPPPLRGRYSALRHSPHLRPFQSFDNRLPPSSTKLNS